MRVGDVIAEVMKRERAKVLFVYPLTPLTEYAAAADIRPIVVRQERVGCAMADAGGRLSSGDDVAVFACQGGPGIENAFGAVAQAYSEGVPLVVLVPGPSRALANVPPNFSATLNYQHITKSAETVTTPEMIVPALRRAFTLARNGRPGPCLVEVCDVFQSGGSVAHDGRRAQLRAHPADAHRSGSQGDRRRGRGLDQGEDAADLRRVKACTTRRHGPSSCRWRSCSRPRSVRAWRGKARSPKLTRLALGAGGNTMSRALATHVQRVGRGLRRRRELQPRLFHQMADEGQALHPQHRGRAGPQQDYSDQTSGAWRCQAHARDAAPGAERAAARQAARSYSRGRRAHRGARTAHGSKRGCRTSRAMRSRCRPTASSTICCRPSMWPTRSSRTMPAARAMK